MHIPDNYLSPSTCLALGAAMVPVWGVAVRKVKQDVTKSKIPLLGIGAAFTFLLMMFNLPLPGGTTGHAVGGTLLAILLGPFPACISITVALLIQALLFGDGGILSFGANCFNMAFILPFSGYFIYKLVRSVIKSPKGEWIGIFSASYLALNFAALFTAIEFGIQPLLFKSASGQPLYCPYPLSVSVPAMTIPHLLVAGFAEAIFTVAILVFIKKVAPDMLYEGSKQKIRPVYGLVGILICLTPLGLFAAGTAWGEWGPEELMNVMSGGSSLGFIPEGIKNGFSFKAALPDYTLSGLPEAAGYVLSAAAGVAILLILFKITGVLLRNRTGKNEGKTR